MSTEHTDESVGYIRRRRTGELDTTVSRLQAENERLRAAIDEAIQHIDASHRLIIKEGYCRICGASDGHWPCVPVEATRILRDAL